MNVSQAHLAVALRRLDADFLDQGRRIDSAWQWGGVVPRSENVNGVRNESSMLRTILLAVLAVVDPARTDANTMAARWDAP